MSMRRKTAAPSVRKSKASSSNLPPEPTSDSVDAGFPAAVLGGEGGDWGGGDLDEGGSVGTT